MRIEKILLVDDSKEILESLSEYLRTEGYEVDTASNGLEGIAMIEKSFYDIVLTDMMMPGADGMEVLKYIKANSSDSLCIVLTGTERSKMLWRPSSQGLLTTCPSPSN